MKPDIWMPLYIGDYLADTIGLTDQQHGRYLMSIMAYWRKASPLTQTEAQAILKDDADALKRFFQVQNGDWRHKRIDEELSKFQEFSNAKSRRTEAARSALQKKRASATNIVTNSVTMPVTESPSPSPSPSPSNVFSIPTSHATDNPPSVPGVQGGKQGEGVFQNKQPNHKPTGNMALVLAREELARIEKATARIRAQYEPHETKSDADKAEIKRLNTRAGELKQTLGYSV